MTRTSAPETPVAVVVIKRYENRKLYDARARAYVTLADLARVVADGGEIQVVDKTTGRAGFLEGAVELKFRASMAHLAAGTPSAESVDEFLGHYEALLTNSVALH